MSANTTPAEAVTIAIARARLKRDPAVRALLEQEGVSLDDAAREYAAELRRRMTRTSTLPPESQDRFEPAGSQEKTLPEAVLAVLKEAGRPMTRMEIYDEAVKRGWITKKNEPQKQVGTAVHRLLKKGKIEQMGGKKPRRVRLPETVGGVEDYF